MKDISRDWKAVTEKEKDEISPILSLYDLDDALLYEITVGGANEKYAVVNGDDTYFLRKSGDAPLLDVRRPQTRLQQLRFQAEVLEYLAEKGFGLTPRVYKNKEGSFITDDRYMLFSFAQGERKCYWNDLKDMTPKMLHNLFFALGTFARVLEPFSPVHATDENTIMDYAERSEMLLDELLRKVPECVREMVLPLEQDLKGFAVENRRLLEDVGYCDLPRQVIHFDYHAGNVHFRGEDVSAILDIDWIRLDNRFLDLATGLSMSCPFRGQRAGRYSGSLFQRAFDAYREGFGPSEYPVEEQKRITKAALRSYIFFQLLYDLAHWVRHKPEGDEGEYQMHVIRYQLNTLLANDFDELFREGR